MRLRSALTGACFVDASLRASLASKALFCLTLLLVLVASGCATPPALTVADEVPSRHFELSARLSIRVDQKVDVVNIRWTRTAERETIVLLSPLGSTVARLEQLAGRDAELDEGRGPSRRAASIAALIGEVLGQPVPLQELAWWLQGWQSEGSAPLVSTEFRHQDWTVALERAPGGRVQRLEANQGDLRLRLVLDTWERRP
jgi:outer membrane biogenesis lipoprotein LolB